MHHAGVARHPRHGGADDNFVRKAIIPSPNRRHLAQRFSLCMRHPHHGATDRVAALRKSPEGVEIYQRRHLKSECIAEGRPSCDLTPSCGPRRPARPDGARCRPEEDVHAFLVLNINVVLGTGVALCCVWLSVRSCASCGSHYSHFLTRNSREHAAIQCVYTNGSACMRRLWLHRGA